MILKFGCVANYLYVPTLAVSDSEIWVGLIGVSGIRSKMLLIRNYCGSWDMNAPGPSKVNDQGFLTSFLHTTIIFIRSEHSSFSLQCGGSDDLLSWGCVLRYGFSLQSHLDLMSELIFTRESPGRQRSIVQLWPHLSYHKLPTAPTDEQTKLRCLVSTFRVLNPLALI